MSNIIALSLGIFVLSGVVGCTVVEPCGAAEREYCTEEGECTCGEGCDEGSDCDDDQLCKKYRYDDSHGVCISQSWLQEHGSIYIPTQDAGTD